MPVFDVYDSATNTELVNRALQSVTESTARVGHLIAPLVNTTQDRVKRTVIEVGAIGAAQVVSRYAAPAIFTPQLDYSQEWIELVKLDEMTPIEEDEWKKLVEGNEYERNAAGANLIQRARMLQIRSEVRTEIMRWAAFHDDLKFQLAESGANPQEIQVVYGQPSANRPTGSDWSEPETSTPIQDLRGWQKIPFEALSNWGMDIYMSNNTWEALQSSNEVRDLLKPVVGEDGSDFFIPTKRQIERLLIGGGIDERTDTQRAPKITITDAGYRPESAGFDRSPSGTVKYLPDWFVLVTAGPTIEGENVAEVLNGRVAVKRSATSEPEWVQGPFNHTWSSSEPPYTHYNRQVCKRIPRINHPEALVYGYVGAPA
jgi:hypothetical protein